MLVHGPYPIGEPRVAREAAVARDVGFEVDVVAMRRGGEPRRETVDGVHVIRLPLSRRRGAGLAGTLLEYLAFTLIASAVVAWGRLRRGYRIVHVHNPPDFLIVAALIPKLLGARVIFDVHDLSSHMFGARFHGWWARAAQYLLRSLQRLASRLADAVLTVHEPYRQELVRQGVNAERITVVMNTVDERLLPNSGSGTRSGAPRVVYHGTITHSYGVDLLVEAARRLRAEGRAFRVELYGEGDALKAVLEAIDEAGLAESFLVSGSYLAQGEVLARVAGASVGVIPNLAGELNRFALSSKLFEYVALGIPVVSADLPTLREHFADEEVRFFRAGDAESLADALGDVMANPDEAAMRVERARRRYEKYRWPIQAARYADVLRRLEK
jgi:glycosyltransferase involved in cell wall biosynthesis